MFPFDFLISYLSTFATLKPGDMIATGTPTGAGARFTPPRWLKPGDVVEVESSQHRHSSQHRRGGAVDDARSAQSSNVWRERLDEAERTKIADHRVHRRLSRSHDRGCLCDPARLDEAAASNAAAVIKGHKIGLTSKAMQNAVGISEPDYGVLFADMFYPDAAPHPVSNGFRAAHRGRTGVRAEGAI